MLSVAETARLTLPPKDGGKTATPHRQDGTFIFVITAVLGDVAKPSEPNCLDRTSTDVNAVNPIQPTMKQ